MDDIAEPDDLEVKRRGRFFAIERGAWDRVIGLGLNQGCAFMVMAAGTGRGQRRTPWSVWAIERYAAIGRQRAGEAIQALIAADLVRVVKGGTRPLYDIGLPPPEDANPSAPEWIWLPTTIVTGTDATARRETPLARIRQTRNAEALRMLVELYACHDLPGEGGIDRRALVSSFIGRRIYDRGAFVVWAFQRGRKSASATRAPGSAWRTGEADAEGRDTGSAAFWGAINVLQDLGMVEWVPHLCESGPDGEIIHSLAATGGTPDERRAFFAARGAALALLPAKLQSTVAEGAEILVPVHRHMGDVEMAEICRMTYRPHTGDTGRWWEKMAALADIAAGYETIIVNAGREVPRASVA